MRGRLAGKVALITGASRGLGALEAVMFAKEGAQAVIVSDVSQSALQETVKAVEELGGATTVIPLELNVTLEEDWTRRQSRSRSGLGNWIF